jgi:hypothetical protein
VTGRPYRPVAFPALGAVLCEPFVELHDPWDGEKKARLGEVMAAPLPDSRPPNGLAGEPLARR